MRNFLMTIGAILCSQAAIAHHSFATHYDTANIVQVSGTLTEVKMRSPHSFFSVEVTNDDGSTEIWEAEAHAIPILRRLGINNETLKVGDTVTFRGPRSRRPSRNLLFGAEITTSSGEQFEMLNSIREAPVYDNVNNRENETGLDKISGKWMTYITGQRVADSPLPLNDAGIEARRNFNATKNSSSECVPSNLPSLLMIPYLFEISHDGDAVQIFHEYSKIYRPVTLGSDVPNVSDPSFGARTGRFENDTLIIESTDFPALSAGLASGWEPNGNGADVPSSAQKHLVERYRVNGAGSELTVEYTVTDPAYLTEPYTAEITWHRMPDDATVYEFDCDAEIATRSTENAAILN